MQRSALDIPTPDGVADAYLACPDGDPRGGVLLMMDAFGLRPQLEAMADQLAHQGYAVLAPNLFYRAGRAPALPMPDLTEEGSRQAFFAEMKPLTAPLSPAALATDGAAYLDALAAAGAGGRVAIVGYCMGVRYGWRIATAHPDRVALLAGFHGGGLVTNDPTSPHRSAGELRATVYLGHADHDASNSPEQVVAMDEALDAAGVDHTTELYVGAPHGYTMADTPSYREEAAARHDAVLRELLADAFND
jgi:carboxymethylenebutenolidase